MHTHTRSACKAHTTPHITEHYAESVPPHVQYSTDYHITPLPHGVAHHTHAFAHMHAHTTTTWASCRSVTTVQLVQAQRSLLSPDFALVQGGFGSCVLPLLVPKMGLSLCSLYWCFPSTYSVYMLPFVLMTATPAACTSVLFPMPISAFSYQHA